jgi:hypothetical protein
MISYRLEQEKEVFIHFAELLNDDKAKFILEAGEVTDDEEARYLSQFFWRVVNKSVEIKQNNDPWPFENGGEFWLEKLHNSIGGYLERAGYEDIWDDEVDKA